MMIGRNYFLLFCICFLLLEANAQIYSGKIVYERRTNLFKKYKDDNVREWIKEEEKNKIDFFELYFTDSSSVFMSKESDLRDRMSWATTKNTVFQDFNNDSRLTIKTIWGEKIFIKDSLYKREWKITESKRSIAGFTCRKAIWKANDTTNIYAWYCDEVIANVGPESFYGLPGAILGLATEDGGVIYFAKSVENMKPKMSEVIPNTGKSKIYSTPEIKAKLEKDFSKNPWGKAMIKENFGIW